MPSDRAGSVAGVVLAAGTSTRMGQNKLFMEIEGEPLVRRVVGRASKAGFDPLIVVLGHEAELVQQALEGIRYRPVLNPEYARGLNSSLRAGIRAVSETAARAAVVVLADMPFVTTAMIETLIGKYRGGDAPLVISDYDGVNAPPIVYDRSLFDELATSEGQGCGRHVVKRHRHEAESASWPVEALTDLDAPEDYERVKAAVAVAVSQPAAPAREARDPVCGMAVAVETARHHAAEHAGRTYYFCCGGCRERFLAAPDRYGAAVVS